MLRAAELLLLGGFGAPNSDKMAVLHHFTVSQWVSGGGVHIGPIRGTTSGPQSLICMLPKLQEVVCAFLLSQFSADVLAIEA